MKMIKSQRGLGMIEFMFSMAILAIVALTSFYSLTTAKQMSEDSRYRLTAVNAARTTLEQIKNTALASVSSISTSSFVPATLPSGTITIATNPASIGSSTVATVTVTVSWRGAKNRQQQLQVSTMRSIY